MAFIKDPQEIASPKRVIVIGSGWNGLAAAKTYLELDPNLDLTIIEADSGIGGVWSKSRQYPGLKADSPVGLYEYSDVSMTESLGLKMWDDIPAEQVLAYLTRYAEKHRLLKHIRLNTIVSKATEGSDSTGIFWTLHIQEHNKSSELLRCSKLIVATGLFSKPHMPNFDSTSFKGPVIHSKEVAAKYRSLTAPDIRNVVVIGGSKSAGEMANLFASQGKHVLWLIRRDGNGPGFLLNPRTKQGEHYSKFGNRRWHTLVSPNPFRTQGFWYEFLHSGKHRLGSWLVRKYWDLLTSVSMKGIYDGNENVSKITPDVGNMFWTTGGIATYADNEMLFARVRKGTEIEVQRAEIVRFTENSAVLSNGMEVKADAVICCTGWKYSQPSLFDHHSAMKMGLPASISTLDPVSSSRWGKIDEQADRYVCSTFSLLAKPPYPLAQVTSRTETPFRLYRSIAPPVGTTSASERSIIFLGTLVNVQIPIYAELSALWGVAFLEGMFRDEVEDVLGDGDKMEWEVAKVNKWMEKRYRRRRGWERNVDVELLDFIDAIMGDLGLAKGRRWRGGNEKGFGRGKWGVRGLWREWMESYKPGDYKGVVQEFLEAWMLLRQGGSLG